MQIPKVGADSIALLPMLKVARSASLNLVPATNSLVLGKLIVKTRLSTDLFTSIQTLVMSSLVLAVITASSTKYSSGSKDDFNTEPLFPNSALLRLTSSMIYGLLWYFFDLRYQSGICAIATYYRTYNILHQGNIRFCTSTLYLVLLLNL